MNLLSLSAKAHLKNCAKYCIKISSLRQKQKNPNAEIALLDGLVEYQHSRNSWSNDQRNRPHLGELKENVAQQMLAWRLLSSYQNCWATQNRIASTSRAPRKNRAWCVTSRTKNIEVSDAEVLKKSKSKSTTMPTALTHRISAPDDFQMRFVRSQPKTIAFWGRPELRVNSIKQTNLPTFVCFLFSVNYNYWTYRKLSPAIVRAPQSDVAIPIAECQPVGIATSLRILQWLDGQILYLWVKQTRIGSLF